MTPQQLRTVKRLALLGVAFVVLVVYALVIEAQAVVQGGNSTISEILWLVWANQPWVVLLLAILATLAIGFLLGHFFGQASDKYAQLRGGVSRKTRDRLRAEDDRRREDEDRTPRFP